MRCAFIMKANARHFMNEVLAILEDTFPVIVTQSYPQDKPNHRKKAERRK